MGHGITEHDRMAWIKGLPWHGLGIDAEKAAVELRRDLTFRFLYDLTLDWKVGLRPLFELRAPEDVVGSVTQAEWFVESLKLATRQVTEARAIVREDTGARLGVVGKGYAEIQNETLLDLAEAVAKLTGLAPETAGSLEGGRSVWMLGRLADSLEVRTIDGRRDEVARYFLLSSSHDGSATLKAMPTCIRVVCKNTLQVALGQAKRRAGIGYSLRHTTGHPIKVEGIRSGIAEEVAYFEAFRGVAQRLAEQRIDAATLEGFAWSAVGELEAIMSPDQVVAELREGGKTERQVERVAEEAETLLLAARTGAGNTGETAWDAFNGFTDWLDHQRTRYSRGRDFATVLERRFASVLGDEGLRKRRHALDLLTRKVGA